MCIVYAQKTLAHFILYIIIRGSLSLYRFVLQSSSHVNVIFMRIEFIFCLHTIRFRFWSKMSIRLIINIRLTVEIVCFCTFYSRTKMKVEKHFFLCQKSIKFQWNENYHFYGQTLKMQKCNEWIWNLSNKCGCCNLSSNNSP